MARNNKNRNPAPETPPETAPETAEKAFLVVVRKVALGNGTRQPGFVLGEIKDIEDLSPEGVIPAEDVIKAELINALANPDIYKIHLNAFADPDVYKIQV